MLMKLLNDKPNILEFVRHEKKQHFFPRHHLSQNASAFYSVDLMIILISLSR